MNTIAKAAVYLAFFSIASRAGQGTLVSVEVPL